MPGTIRLAALLMLVALACYTTGVWGERFAGRLRPWHAALFWLGLMADSGGTELMRRYAGGLTLGVHTLTGLLALILMLLHAGWATVVLRRGDTRALTTFHRVSVVVWTIWLVPFLSGMVMGMRHRL
jgi:uncharacterized repeat protein (TIGR03987 family)